MIMGENIHIHGRLVVDALCRSYLQIHPDAENRKAIEQVARIQLTKEVDLQEEPDIGHLTSGDACFLTNWEEVEEFVSWIKQRAPY